MNDTIKAIVIDFEVELLQAIWRGGGEIELLRARDAAHRNYIACERTLGE